MAGTCGTLPARIQTQYPLLAQKDLGVPGRKLSEHDSAERPRPDCAKGVAWGAVPTKVECSAYQYCNRDCFLLHVITSML